LLGTAGKKNEDVFRSSGIKCVGAVD